MAKINVSQMITLDRHITREEMKHPGATGEFTYLLHDLSFAIRIITREVRRAGLNDILGLAGDINVHGEQVKRLDLFANDIIIKSMERGGHLALMASEENENVIKISSQFNEGKYILVFDPLDGSSNIDINVTIGTIFGFYKRLDHNPNGPDEKDVLQPGYKQVAAGYALYGSSTVFVYTTGQGVNMFTFDPTIGEFLLSNENVKIPKQGSFYSYNEGYYNRLDLKVQQYLDYLKTNSDDKKRPYCLRYIGTGIADFHRTLLYGGIFLYPADSKNPKGKLRLVYEANPLAMIVEQAGGLATDGERRILDILPTNIHERIPLFIGSEDDVLELKSFLKGQHQYQLLNQDID